METYRGADRVSSNRYSSQWQYYRLVLGFLTVIKYCGLCIRFCLGGKHHRLSEWSKACCAKVLDPLIGFSIDLEKQ